jgi:hypothetical protein
MTLRFTTKDETIVLFPLKSAKIWKAGRVHQFLPVQPARINTAKWFETAANYPWRFSCAIA